MIANELGGCRRFPRCCARSHGGNAVLVSTQVLASVPATSRRCSMGAWRESDVIIRQGCTRLRNKLVSIV